MFNYRPNFKLRLFGLWSLLTPLTKYIQKPILCLTQIWRNHILVAHIVDWLLSLYNLSTYLPTLHVSWKRNDSQIVLNFCSEEKRERRNNKNSEFDYHYSHIGNFPVIQNFQTCPSRCRIRMTVLAAIIAGKLDMNNVMLTKCLCILHGNRGGTLAVP